MLGCDLASLVLFLSVPAAAWAGVLTIAQLAGVALLAGACAVIFTTAYTAYLPAIVAPEDLTEGNAKLTGSASAAQIGGPGLGGAIAQLAGAATGLLADAASFAVSFVCLTAVRAAEPRPGRPTAATTSLTREIRDGLDFLLRDPYLRPLIVFSALANLGLTGVDAIMVLFLARTLGLSAGAVGTIVALLGVGGVLGAVLAGTLSRRWGTARTVLACAVGGLPFALLMPLTTRGAGLGFFAVGLLVTSAVLVTSRVLRSAFIQAYVPPSLLGRVTAGSLTVGFSCMPLGALLAGALATALGARSTLWILTAGLACTGFTLLASPLRHRRDFPSKWENRTKEDVLSK
jgi:predicted MFS family arabinose efflux permease